MKEQFNKHKQKYIKDGYFVIKNYFTEAQISELRSTILKFHKAWIEDNLEFYNEIAFNSSLITGSQYLESSDRIKLFNFISSNKMMDLINTSIDDEAAFMNTQLFFNPINKKLKDFWHRDCQYDFDLEDQKRVITETQVVHFRVPLFEERGVELIAGTHLRWDNEEEFNVRQELNGKSSNDSLTNGKSIELSPGDVLVFSADMIHRGLYGLDRLALDILVFDTKGNYVDYIDDDCLPNKDLLKKINNPELFKNSINLKKS